MSSLRASSRVLLSAIAFCALAVPPASAQTESVQIEWEEGPGTGEIGNIAKIRIPEGFRFAGRAGVKRFMELTQNPTSGNELAVMLSPGGPNDETWFVIFEFNPIGYVKDDEKGTLDANAILKSLKAGNERGNEERRKRGWSTLDLVGWRTPPRYDPITNNLTWAIRATSEGTEVINHSVRLLGRRGVMDADLVLSPGQVATAVPDFDSLLSGFEFVPGNRYAEWVKGDRVAQYGLTALVAGGVGAAAVKSGLLGKLWKVLVFGVLAVGAALKKFLSGLFGSKEPQVEASASPR